MPSVHRNAVQVPEKKNALNLALKVRPSALPVCIDDGNPYCEREAWENIPIVSSMCQKCTLFCRQKTDGGVAAADEEHHGVRLLPADEGGARAKGGLYGGRCVDHALRVSQDVKEGAKSESKMDNFSPIGN